MTQPIIACTLVDAAFVARKEAIRASLLDYLQESRELEDGYAFRFDANAVRAAQLFDFIEAERECCPFFTFELIFEPENGPVWLRLRGSDEIKRFIEVEFMSLVAHNPAS